MAKGVGAIFYIDVDSDDQYRDVGCIYGITPPGFSRGSQDGEACLGDAAAIQETGDLTYSPLSGTLQANPDSTIDNELEAAIIADTTIQWCIKHPLATPVYQFGSGKLSELTPEGFERDSHMKKALELLPDATPTYSATAPTLEA